MTTYVVLASFTDQGIRTVKDTTKRADAVKDMAGRFGVKMREIYWTQGQYDLVTLLDADNEQAVAAFGLAVSSAGNVRFETLRAFTKDEMTGILAKLP
ncbi:GYD domain-containing protein [Caenimonas soli]|uniref:GYD domain-containing protein n=1 Tax=Caenimonas soli TaxID=2735555 RepID=UPI0015547B3E|nr:GYD domain-containing protein [Caenimonas soli]NPC58966.1 GYD domain-containing protein [Caenimonas soli]